MTEDEFWEIIAKSETVNPGTDEKLRKERIQRLQGLLLPLPLAELNDYLYHFRKLYYRLYRWDVRYAAAIIDDDVAMSDDSFAYFRSWLITLGKDAYYSVSQEPDTLEQFVTDNMKDEDDPSRYYLQWEVFAYLTYDVYEEKTGEDQPDNFGKIRSSQAPEDIEDIMIARDWGPPAGEWRGLDDKDALRRKYPRTMARFEHLELYNNWI